MVERCMIPAFLLVCSTRRKALGVHVSSPLEMVEELREQAVIQSLRHLLNPAPTPHRTHPTGDVQYIEKIIDIAIISAYCIE